MTSWKPLVHRCAGLVRALVSSSNFPCTGPCTEVTKTPRHHPLVTDFLGNAQRLFAQFLRLRNGPTRTSLVIERQVSERLALALPIPRRARARAHVLRFSNRLR